MKLRLTSRALTDIANIAEHIGSENPSAARMVLERIEEELERIKRSPFIGRPSERAGLREFVLRPLPLLLIYRKRNDLIEVITIFHTSRAPSSKNDGP